jgi:dissimilatory sulfite reductase (desulfoviridin) alpha/beta subunit
LTSRQAVEIPGVRGGDLESLKAVLAEGGAQSCVLGPRVRTVTACQGLDTCKWSCLDTQALAAELNERYYGRQLPGKFRLGVTGCRNNCLKTEETDLGVKGAKLPVWSQPPCRICGGCVAVCRVGALTLKEDGVELDRSKCLQCGRCVKTCPTGAWRGEPAFDLSLGGRFGNRSDSGRRLIPVIKGRDRLVRAIDAAMGFYEAHGEPGRRFRDVVEAAGWEALTKAVTEALAV